MNSLAPYHLNTGFIDYLRSSQSFADKRRSIASGVVLLLWLAVAIFLSAKHEVWRDEVRALSIALEPDYFWQLPLALKNEGHPILWYLILRTGFFVFRTPVVLKIVSVGIGLAGVTVFLRYAPFPTWQKLLFMWGILPLYEYTIMVRGYGVSMLLFFAFAALYLHRRKRPFLLAGVLAILANSDVHSCLLVGVLAAFWFWDGVVMEHDLSVRKSTVLACLVLVGVGILGAVATFFPTQETIVTKVLSLNTTQVIESFWTNIKHPSQNFREVFPRVAVSYRDIMLWLLVAGLLIRPHAAVSLWGGIVLLGTFFTAVFHGFLRHQGIFILFLISLYWLVRQEGQPLEIKGKLKQGLYWLHQVAVYVVLSAVFISMIRFGVPKAWQDVTHQKSSSQALGQFLNAHPEYQSAIIIGEPDYVLESLPYYAPNRLYIPREKTFRNRVMLVKSAQVNFSLGQLLNTARQLQNSEQKPVLIVLGHFDLSAQPPFKKSYSFNKIFTWSVEELADFKARTVKIAEFRAATLDENYEVYLFIQ
ncbi:MAG: hypothetical protein JW953_17450 [Anaerolineae bacterium]|nr:hypothetical protein [Anaerolineae bacterium]